MCNSSQRCLYASEDDRDIGINLFQDVAINYRGVIRTETSLASWSVSVVGTKAFVSCIMVHHRVHAACRDAEKQPRLAEFPEVAQVVTPVGLRDDAYFVAFLFKCASDNRRPERWMVDVRVAADKHDVELVPPAQVGFLLCYRQPL